MANLAKISRSSVWCVLLGGLAIGGMQSAACSSPFRSCYETRTCPVKPQDEAGAAGEEAGGDAAGGVGPSAGAGGGDLTETGGVTGEGAEAGVDSSGAGGGADIDGAPLGSACRQADECASAHCSDGVCCDRECTGPCAQCNADGKCSAPKDDPACPVISCGAGTNECAIYDAEISTDRCLSIGVCKGPSNCGSTPKPARTACGTGSSDLDLCNNVGTCAAPVVKCGTTDCAIGRKVCCFRRSGSTTTQTCEDSANCIETPASAEPARTPTECDEHTDCRTGYLCSHVTASGGSHTYCTLAAEANISSAMANWYEVCESPAKIDSCSGGRSCSLTDGAFPGWKFCAHLAGD